MTPCGGLQTLALAILPDPAPQRSDRTVHGSIGELPSLALTQLAADERLNSAALSHLLNRALEEKRLKGDQEKRKKEVE